MDVDDVLKPLPSGPRGVAGDFLARLEQKALAEQARLEAEARGERPSPAAGGASSNGSKTTPVDDRPTYVPGQKRTNGAAVSTAPAAAAAAAGREGSNHATTSTSNSSINNSSSNNAARASSPAEPPAKKQRIQPTIRMQFTFPPYPPGKDPIAKHVPIFNVHDLAASKGLLLPPEEEMIEEGSSSGGSDDEGADEEGSGDNEAGETSVSNAKPKENETESQRQLREAIELAKRSKRPVMLKKRILERDEGYDSTDPFVDDSELAINEPKVQARPKVEGYVAIQGIVEVYDNKLSNNNNNSGNATGTSSTAGPSGSNAPGRQGGRKAGSVNKPKVPMKMPDGTTKMVSEAVAAREAKKLAKAEGRDISGPAAPDSASASPAPTPNPSTSNGQQIGSPGKPSSSSGSGHVKSASESAPPLSSHSFSSLLNPNGPLISRDAVPYSHLPSSTNAFGFPDSDQKIAQTPPPPSNGASMRPSAPPTDPNAGSRTSPINIDDDNDVDISFAPSANGDMSSFGNKPISTSSSAPPPASRPSNVFAFDPSPNKKDGKRVYDYQPVSQELEAQLEILRKAVSKESFVPKNKFPPSIKPILMETALKAMKTGEYDDNFFNIMPNIFPYNRFTMHKMIKREVCEIRCQELEEEIKIHVEELKNEVTKSLPENVKVYEEQLEKWKVEHEAWEKEKGSQNTNHNGLSAEGNPRNSLTPVGSDGDSAAVQQGDAAAKETEPPKPQPKFRFTQNMRMCLFKIMTLSSEVTERQTDKATVEDKDPPSAMNATKARYATLVPLWPEGWMTSNQLSRELTQAKKKVQSQMNK